MRYRMLDVNGDYSFGRGQQNITYGVYAVAQAIKTNLMLFQNEWWEDLENGLPIFQQIIGNTGTMEHIDLVDSLIKKRITDTENVTSISDYTSEFNREARSYSFQCNVQTPFGNIVVAKTF